LRFGGSGGGHRCPQRVEHAAQRHARYYPTTLRFRKLMYCEFARVETTPIIWRNPQPAYVYRCWMTRG
jgi:hypothetical protein